MKLQRYFSYDPECEKKLLCFLKNIDKDFPVPLSAKVILKEYTVKLCENACIITLEEEGKVFGMIAGYIENLQNNMAYISILGVSREMRGKGFAGLLLTQFLNVCEQKKIDYIHVYAKLENIPAIKTYKRNGFEKYNCDSEERPQDEHLIKKLR